MNLLGSHDLARFLHFARGDKSALRLATLFQMTFPGAPSIYYGDEIGLAGGHDPDNRRAFRWDRPETWDTRPPPRLPEDGRPPERSVPRSASGLVHVPVRRRGRLRLPPPARRRVGRRRLQRRRTDRAGRPPGGRHLAEGSVLDEAWTRETARVEAGHFRGIELAPRSGRVFATPAGPVTDPTPPPAWRLPEGVNAAALDLRPLAPAGDRGRRLLRRPPPLRGRRRGPRRPVRRARPAG